MENIQPSTFNAERRKAIGARTSGHWALKVECSMLNVCLLFLPLAPVLLRAQSPPQISADAAAQMIMQPQPAVDNSRLENVSARAEFDPPVVRPGEKTLYRVSINATENSILWPGKIPLPPELRPGSAARGQLTQPDGVPFHPLTEFIQEVAPVAAGRFTVSNFVVSVGGRGVKIPAATLDARADVDAPPPRKLKLEISETNLFFGQPFLVRVIAPAEGLRDVQFNGDGFMADKLSARVTITSLNIGGQPRQAYIYETVLTPLGAGLRTVSVQAFTTSPFSAGPITITAGSGPVVLNSSAQTTPTLLVSDELRLYVLPTPEENEPPGFTGAMGKFSADPPQLSTNRLRVGEPAHLKLNFRGAGELTRFVPPAMPRSRDWQIIADNPPATGFTLIPQTDEARATPAIPFSCFDPATGKYVDLTVPPLPVTVVGESLPVQLPPADDENQSAAPMKLSGLAPAPGKTAAGLKPLQLRGWFVVVQLLPVAGLFALWRWDGRRRFLEAHPEIVRRRRAKRALRREKLKMQKAFESGDSTAFARRAADAMRIAVSPHFPAHPRALVRGDVLAQLGSPDQNGRAVETVREIFTAADSQFAASAHPHTGCLALKSGVEAVLQKLEERL